MFTTTVKELFDSLEKNGFEHLRGSWFKYDNDGLIVGGCVLGQAAINLGAWEDANEAGEEGTITRALDEFPITEGRWTEWPDNMNEWDRPQNVGSQIIFWNDVTRVTGVDENENNVFEYRLKTWPEVVEMARECLTPYFDKQIQLKEHDWKAPIYDGLDIQTG